MGWNGPCGRIISLATIIHRISRLRCPARQQYLGNQAKPQLVRNAANTINFFRNLLGRRYVSLSQPCLNAFFFSQQKLTARECGPFPVSYSELSDSEKERSSSKVIDVNGVPSFKVEIDGKETVLSAHDVAVRYLRSLLGSAQDFLSGVPIAGAVLGVPLWFSAKQMDAVCAAAKEAGIEVLQLIPEPIAAVVAYGLTSPRGPGRLPAHPDGAEGPAYQAGAELDRNVLVLDMGGTSTDITLLSAREGLYAPLAFVHDPALGGRALDDALVQHFAKEFTKKTKIEITPDNARAWAKLRNEAEVTKRALSASNSAQCSVESLAEGIDFSGSVNRMRLDILGGTVYGKVQQRVEEVLQEAGIEACQVDEVSIYGPYISGWSPAGSKDRDRTTA